MADEGVHPISSLVPCKALKAAACRLPNQVIARPVALFDLAESLQLQPCKICVLKQITSDLQALTGLDSCSRTI